MTQVKDYTHNFNMRIPEFNIATWHDAMEYNFTLLDALLGNFFEANKFKGPWLIVTGYHVGDIVYIDLEDDQHVGKIFKVLQDHVSGNMSFEAFYAEHPEYYEEYADMNGVINYFNTAKDYAIKMDGRVVENGTETDYSAKHYANESANSATLANEYKTNAFTYKTDAESAKTSAEDYATAAQGYMNVAEQHKTNASSYMNSASDSATLAQQAKNDAQLAANSANSSASFAQQSESNAAQSAIIAQSSKESVQTSETVVQTARDETKTYADFVKDNLSVFTNDIKILQDSVENIETTIPQLVQQERDRAITKENELDNKIDALDIPDISHLATKTELNEKQDTIDDLDTIRDNAEKGETAVQPEQLSGKLLTEEQKARLSALNMQYKEVIIPPEDLDLSSIDVSKDGAEYGFYYNQETNSLCPQNTGVDDSFSYGKITFNIQKDTTVIVSFRQSSEQNYDYGMISNLDESLSHSISNDSNVKWSGNPHGIIEDSITYDVPAGEHFITFKYIKDSSDNSGDDCFEITNIKINGYTTKSMINYDTKEEIDLSTDLSNYYTKTEMNDNFVTTNTEQTINNKKIFSFTESVVWGGQESILKILSTHTNNELTEPMWSGRITVGNKNKTFLMGVYHQEGSNTPMCGLGAHRWSNSFNDSGAAWEDVYIQPDGNTSVYIGGYNWTANTGWFRVKNSGSNTGGKVQLNIGTASSPNWKDVATDPKNYTNYNASKIQTLKNINGVLTWVDD